MGANEKHDATYHGGEYVPATNDIREVWGGFSEYGGLVIRPSGTATFLDDRYAEFDRWLETVRAEAKAEAYKDAERILHEEARWQLDLHQRHKEYRFKHCSERMTEMENCMTVRAEQYKENQS